MLINICENELMITKWEQIDLVHFLFCKCLFNELLIFKIYKLLKWIHTFLTFRLRQIVVNYVTI